MINYGKENAEALQSDADMSVINITKETSVVVDTTELMDNEIEE